MSDTVKAKSERVATNARRRLSNTSDYYTANMPAYMDFIARMVREHKASVVASITNAQDELDKCVGADDATYWRDIIVQFTAQLELSDVDILPYIHSTF